MRIACISQRLGPGKSRIAFNLGAIDVERCLGARSAFSLREVDAVGSQQRAARIAVTRGCHAGKRDEHEVALRRVSRHSDLGRIIEGSQIRVYGIGQHVEQREVGDSTDQATREDQLQPADAVRQSAENHEERRGQKYG